jgi:PAS domain-containing protein
MDSTAHELSRVLVELGLVVIGLAFLARIASRWAFSAIPLYLLAGLAFGNGGLAQRGFCPHRRWYGTNMDIKDRKRAEEILQESERRVRLIVDGIAGLVAIMAPDGQVEYVNSQTLEYFGRTLEELKSWGTSDAVHPDDLPRVVAA